MHRFKKEIRLGFYLDLFLYSSTLQTTSACGDAGNSSNVEAAHFVTHVRGIAKLRQFLLRTNLHHALIPKRRQCGLTPINGTLEGHPSRLLLSFRQRIYNVSKLRSYSVCVLA